MSTPYNKLSEDTNPFSGTEIFGKNYQTALTDPKNQQQHEQSVGAQNPAKLEFQAFNLPNDASPAYTTTQPQSPKISANNQQTQPLMSDPDTTGFEQPVLPGGPPEPPKNYKVWNIEYYHFLFDVNAKQVGTRILRSLVPYPVNFFETIAPNPDLYGPFWIASTVVFLLAATGNVAFYLNTVNSNPDENFTYDVNKLSYAAAAIYGYLFLMPLVLWGICKFNKIPCQFIEVICLYGYSFFIYMPVSVLCIIPITGLRWGLVGLAGVISTVFIVTNFAKRLQGHLAKGFIILLIMAAFHLGFALTCELYFFTY